MRTTDPSIAVYEAQADEWRRRRAGHVDDAPGRWVAAETEEGPIADLGCGPGWYLPRLGPDAIGVDAARRMLRHARTEAPEAPLVQADLRALPFTAGALGGALALRSYVHLPRSSVPLAWADLHRSLRTGAPLELVVFGDGKGVGAEHTPFDGDDFAGRRFSLWTEDLLRATLEGAGFGIESLEVSGTAKGAPQYRVRARRLRSLADTVGAGMSVLVCGLNPSLYSADAGVGYARPGNRFWPAVLGAGLATVDRDPAHALRHHGLGMTDLVKRATVAAADLDPAEYRAGIERLGRTVEWLRPRVVCFVGLAGWRAAVDRKARAGVQPGGLGGSTVYVLPSTSGLNAHSSLADLTEHFRAVSALAGATA